MCFKPTSLHEFWPQGSSSIRFPSGCARCMVGIPAKRVDVPNPRHLANLYFVKKFPVWKMSGLRLISKKNYLQFSRAGFLLFLFSCLLSVNNLHSRKSWFSTYMYGTEMSQHVYMQKLSVAQTGLV